MAGPQHAQCCCTPPGNPNCAFPCLALTIAGLGSGLCGCGWASIYNTTFTLAQTTEANWYTNTCPTLAKRYCGFYALSVSLTEEAGDWIIRATLIGGGKQIVWKKNYGVTAPDCSTWLNESLTYNAGESDLINGSDPEVDPTGSTAVLTALPVDTVCDQGTECPAEDAPCTSPAFVGVDDMCNDPATIPSQLRVTIPAGNWVDKSEIGGAQVSCDDSHCPEGEGEFILDYDGGCSGVWRYVPSTTGNCRLGSIVASVQRGEGIGSYPNMIDPAEPELRLVVQVNWQERTPSDYPGTIPTSGYTLFTLCLDEFCGGLFDCWMAMEEFEMGMHYNSGKVGCVWEGLLNFTSDPPPRACTKPDSVVPITAQFLP